MTPHDQGIYDQHGQYMAHLVRCARMASAIPLDEIKTVTIQRMGLSGVYHQPGGLAVSMTGERIAYHNRLVDAASAFVAAGRAIADHPDALNPPPAGLIVAPHL